MISSEAMKHLRKVPLPISNKFRRWVVSVQKVGLLEVRKVPAYHDEPLKGKWKGLEKSEDLGRVNIGK